MLEIADKATSFLKIRNWLMRIRPPVQLGNGKWESAKFHSNLQVTELALGASQGNGDLWKLNYEYGELNPNGTVDTAKNTGNIAKQSLSFAGLSAPLVQTYKYDSLYRISEAKEVSGTQQTWIQAFGYDRYGNRTGLTQDILGQQLAINSVTLPGVDQNTNRFGAGQGYVYDKIGNLTKDVTASQSRDIEFDGNNKQTEIRDSATGNKIGEYFYDGNAKRVKKRVFDSSGQAIEDVIFVYSGDRIIAEYSTQPPPQNPTTKYVATDMLGSVRAITNQDGQVISRRDFMPFGEELQPDTTFRKSDLKYNPDDVRQKFTGYQKDEESGLDFAEARMYNNSHGRFTAVDPLLASGKSANPQTFNRYVYVMNRPLSLVDRDGLCPQPQGLQVGQVGICVEAFIQSKKIYGVGNGDNRGYEENGSGSARMRLSMIVSADLEEIKFDVQEKSVSPSTVTIPTGPLSLAGGGVVNTGIFISREATGSIEHKANFNTDAERGSEGFGNATTFDVSLNAGASGFQATAKDLQESSNGVVVVAGKLMEAAAPGGTIDGTVSFKISGKASDGTLKATATSADARPFPTYAAYVYIKNNDGSVTTTRVAHSDETEPKNLVLPKRPIPLN